MGKIGTPRHHNLLGQRFGRLVVIEPSKERSANGGMRWVCKCDCGNVTTVDALSLRRKMTQSCGCYNTDILKGQTIHGHERNKHKTLTYTSWEKMLSRCYKPKDPAYHHYGGKGIIVCERWHTFDNFLADMGERPSKEYTIDRIDSTGNYEPGNCRWADKFTQANNTKRNVFFEYQGEKKTISELAKIAGIPYDTMYGRLQITKMTIEDAMTLPVIKKPYRKRKHTR